MPLVDLELAVREANLPGDVRRFLREAERRIEHFQRDARCPAFVPSQFETVYVVLRELAATGLPRGSLFCEWGSGFGVVACLAALLDFEACGIEIEGELVDAARELADDFEIPAEFVRGSFIPRGSESCMRTGDSFNWLTATSNDAYEELGLSVSDFDVVFAYPWPDEEWLTAALFERWASVGAILVTYHGGDDVRVLRKVGKRGRQR